MSAVPEVSGAPRAGFDLRLGLLIAAAFVVVSVIFGPGQVFGGVIINGGALLIGVAIVLIARRQPGARGLSGQWAVALFALFVALSGISILWSVDPASTWDELNRLIGYLAMFTAAVVAARTWPARWRTALVALAFVALAMSAVAVLTKVLPGIFDPNEQFSRLREPLQYWNAVGLVAATGLPLWYYFGTRRVGRPALDVLAAPVVTLLLVTIMLAYSRGALIAALVATALWLIFCPLRLRTVLVLVPAVLGAGVILVWTFDQANLTQNNVVLAARETAGLRLGVVLLVVLVIVTLASGISQFLLASRGAGRASRRRTGAALLVAVALVPIGGAIALSTTQRGLGGTISHGWNQFTNPNAVTPDGNTPDRLTNAGSVRSQYWRDAINITKGRPVLGAGANGYGVARLRYRQNDQDDLTAHGFFIQVAADLGLVGLALAVALFAAWGIAALRTVGLRRGEPWTAERVGLFAMFCMVVVYGVHSSIDWTWEIPAATLPSLVAAGWLAGRGPLAALKPALAPIPEVTGRGARIARWTPTVQLTLLAIVGLWSIMAPYRAFEAQQNALAALSRDDVPAALKDAKHAVSVDPVYIDARNAVADAQILAGNIPAARATLEKAVALQPANPRSWEQLMYFELGAGNSPARARRAYRSALFLDPYSRELASLVANPTSANAAAATAGQPAPQTGGAATSTTPADPSTQVSTTNK